MLNDIKNISEVLFKIKARIDNYNNSVIWDAKETIQILNIIYNDISDNMFLQRKYDNYIYWKNNYVYQAYQKTLHGITHPNYGKTTPQNVRDKMSKSNSGEKSIHAKLTWDIVKEIRNEYAKREIFAREFAKKYKVNINVILSVLGNKSWKDENYIYKSNHHLKISDRHKEKID